MTDNSEMTARLTSACIPEPVRQVQVVRVIETVSAVGAGIPGNPLREVRQLWSLSGVLLATNDAQRDGPNCGWPPLWPPVP